MFSNFFLEHVLIIGTSVFIRDCICMDSQQVCTRGGLFGLFQCVDRKYFLYSTILFIAKIFLFNTSFYFMFSVIYLIFFIMGVLLKLAKDTPS